MVVSDTSPINYLILADHIHHLPTIVGPNVTVPRAVARELTAGKSPLQVRQWMESAPNWLRVADAPPVAGREGGRRLGAGELEAMSLALANDALLLLDDSKARRLALSQDLRVMGTVGVLVLGARAGLFNLTDAIERLRRTTFYFAPEFLQQTLDEFERGI
jgi:predicted nucleic acid-binding protein